MHYRRSTIPAAAATTVAGLLTLAADINVLEDLSRDAIADAGDRIDWAGDRDLRTATTRTAKAIAAALVAARTGADTDGKPWEAIQATTVELWPILTDAAARAARTEGIGQVITPGRWTI